MNMSNVCATDQKTLIGWLKRKGDAKIPNMSEQLTNRVVTDVRLKPEPALVQYLTNKGKAKLILLPTLVSLWHSLQITPMTKEVAQKRLSVYYLSLEEDGC